MNLSASTFEQAAQRLHETIMKRAEVDGVAYALDPAWFRTMLDRGVRDFFGVHVVITLDTFRTRANAVTRAKEI